MSTSLGDRCSACDSCALAFSMDGYKSHITENSSVSWTPLGSGGQSPQEASSGLQLLPPSLLGTHGCLRKDTRKQNCCYCRLWATGQETVPGSEVPSVQAWLMHQTFESLQCFTSFWYDFSKDFPICNLPWLSMLSQPSAMGWLCWKLPRQLEQGWDQQNPGY